MNRFLTIQATLALMLSLFHLEALAQDQLANHVTYTVSNGLPNNEVRCIYKDSKGYLWIGTTYGLAKYDGNKFSVYQHQSNRNSISGDVITTIFEDKQGNLLVGANGLSVLNTKTGSWSNYLHDPNNAHSISNPSISSIAQENDSIYWVITSNGVNRFNHNTGRFSLLPFSNEARIVLSTIHQITPNQSITFSVASLLYSYNLLSNTYEVIPFGNEFASIAIFENSIVGVLPSQANTNSLIRYNLSTGEQSVLLHDVGDNSVIHVQGNAFHIVYRGVICSFGSDFEITSRSVFQITPGGSNIELQCVIREDNGTFWIGTSNGLLKVLPKSPFQFLDSRNGLPNEYVRALTIDRHNNLWIGVRQGPVYRIPNIDSFLKNPAKGMHTVEFPTPNGEVFATNRILELQNGNLLFVTNRYLFHFNKAQQRFTDRFSIPGNTQFFSALEVPGGVIIGALQKPTLFRITIENGKIKRDPSFNPSKAPDVVYSIIRDSQGKIWVGGEGLFELRMRKNGGSAELRSVIPPINELSYTSNSIWSIQEIESNQLLVSTTTNGFYLFKTDSLTFKHFNKDDGLSTDFTCTALADRNGSLWLSTKEGISAINPKNFGILNYPVKKGEFSSDFTFKCGAITPLNQMLFGSKQGVVYFNPDSVAPLASNAKLMVNEFRVFDRIVKRELTQGDTIVLNHDENFFSFEFSLLDFRNPQDTEYSFRLHKYDKAERQVTNRFNSVAYTDVPPGRYTFRLTSRNSWDHNAEQTIDIKLIIKPAYYQTLWFRLLVGVFILGILGVIIYSIVRRKLLYTRLQKMELDMLRSQINPHFIFNTLTSIQHTILTCGKEVAIDTLSRFSRLMRMFLDYSRMEYIPLDRAISFYETYVTVHSVNLDEPIKFSVRVDEAINQQEVKISPMILQPFIENAIVHGLTPKGKDMQIDLSILKTNGWLSCTVTDNGIGRKRASEIGQRITRSHKSMGIEISSRSILLQLQKGKYMQDAFSIVDNTDEQGNATGTTVHLRIPFRV